MESVDICFIALGVLFVLYVIALLLAIKRAYVVSDDFEFRDGDGDHIYYDRKLIKHKMREMAKKQRGSAGRAAQEIIDIDNQPIKPNFKVEYDVELPLEFEQLEAATIEILERDTMPKGFAVICYNVHSIFSKEYSGVEFELFYGDNAKGNKIVSRSEAMALIDIHELTLVTDNFFGKIWE